MENYEELEGKIIDYVGNEEEIIKAKVALIDPDIGITIVKADDPNFYLSCLIMPGSPKWSRYLKKEDADICFNTILSMIKNGAYLANKMDNYGYSSKLTEEHCAFM